MSAKRLQGGRSTRGSAGLKTPSEDRGITDFTVKAVTRDNWLDLEALFESRGGPKYCWCMAWRPLENRTRADNAHRKRALQSKAEEGVPIGLLGYADGEPVAWCSAGPRETFTRLRDDQQEERRVWSVTCFFIRRDHRGMGLSGRMLDAAVELARRSGARAVEGYPVDPDSPSYRFMGFLALFQKRGFREVARAGSRRHVLRLEL
jgi:GNAT superfamily N-acetyltransferase